MAKTRIMIKLSNGKYIDMSKAKTIKPEDKVHTVMREFKEGKLKSSSGQIVTSRDQALAIAMSESGLSKNMIHDIAIEYDSMEKARPTKYIKRVPKPSGKGYYYFYTREQVKEFQEKGVVPKEEKKERKGIMGAWSALADFFGITGNRGSDETAFRSKINDEYSKHKDKLEGTDISTFAYHLNEFLSNKEKWLAKLSKEKGVKKETGEKKEPSEKKEKIGDKKTGSGFKLSIMKTIAEIYGGAKEEVKKEYQGSQKDEDSKNNFETMPEGEKSITTTAGGGIKVSIPESLSNDDKENIKYAKSAYASVFDVSGKENKYTFKDFADKISKYYSMDNPRNKAIVDSLLRADKANQKPSATEALKEELGKKKSESKEREITVFGKQQKVKTKPIELNLGYGHPFEIAKREFGSGRSDWIILESSTGLKVGDGKTQKEAISNAESMIKNYTPTENEFKKLIDESRPENIAKKEAEKEAEKQKAIKEEEIKTKEKINKEKSSNIYSPDAKKLSYGSINMKNISDEKERMAFEKMKVSNMITDGNRNFKSLFSYSTEGQEQGVWTDSRMMIIDKKIADEIYNTNKQREFLREKKKNPNKSDDEIIKRILEKGEGNFPNWKQVVPKDDYMSTKEAKFNGKYKKSEDKDSVNIAGYSDGENSYYFQPDLVATIKNKFPDAKMYLSTSGTMTPAIFKVGDEIKAVLMPMQRTSDEGMDTLEKAISSLKQELLLKAQPTKYIKKIPNPNGKGYIYFYTQAQVKEYEKTGKLPDDQKKKPEVKESTGKGNIEILKESIKKVASIFADALSAKDAVQPTGQGVEQTGENIAQKSKDKKRLEKQRDIRKNTKKNTPEEKPTK